VPTRDAAPSLPARSTNCVNDCSQLITGLVPAISLLQPRRRDLQQGPMPPSAKRPLRLASQNLVPPQFVPLNRHLEAARAHIPPAPGTIHTTIQRRGRQGHDEPGQAASVPATAKRSLPVQRCAHPLHSPKNPRGSGLSRQFVASMSAAGTCIERARSPPEWQRVRTGKAGA
jgi:hypothetical protein